MRKKRKQSTPRGEGWERWRGEVDTRLEHLHDGQQEQKETLGRVEDKLTKYLDRYEERHTKEQDDLKARLGKAEQTLTHMKAKVAVISGGVGLLSGSASTVLMQYWVKSLLG